MAARNRRNADHLADDIESLSEHAERTGQRIAENGAERSATATALEAFNGPFAKAMDQNRMMIHKMVHAMQEESLRFINRRWEHTGRAIENSRDCQGVMGLMAVQQDFLMELARDYADQTRRFADLVRELTEEGTQGMAEVASSAVDPIRAVAQSSDSGRSAAA
ncbi:MAG: hypothetical protein ABSD74_00755 [Rhizomicrobium sp.]|jgi:hypothetical protein